MHRPAPESKSFRLYQGGHLCDIVILQPRPGAVAMVASSSSLKSLKKSESTETEVQSWLGWAGWASWAGLASEM